MEQKLLKTVQNSNLILFIISTRFVFILTLFTFNVTALLLLQWPQKFLMVCRRSFSHPKKTLDSRNQAYDLGVASRNDASKYDALPFNTMVFLRIFYILALLGSVWAVAASFIATGMVITIASHNDLEFSEWPSVGCTCFISSFIIFLLLCLASADHLVISRFTFLRNSVLAFIRSGSM